MRSFLLIFPNQLFENHPGFALQPDMIVLIEDSLFFGDDVYPLRFHRKKLNFQRTAMKKYALFCQKRGFNTMYLDHEKTKDSLYKHLKTVKNKESDTAINFITIEPVDYELHARLQKAATKLGSPISFLSNPGFINTRANNDEFSLNKKRWRMADFYKWQRSRLNVLMDDGKPLGGKWSFDHDNRKKVPRNLIHQIPPSSLIPDESDDKKAHAYIEAKYKTNPGTLSGGSYPTNHEQAKKWLDTFLEQRFQNFGIYEDAMVKGQNTLWHSVLSPLINIGLLTPEQVLSRCLEFADENNTPLNSLEGFVRQLIGWREFVRATYETLGSRMRTSNHWEHDQTIPKAFYQQTTGLAQVDDCLKRVEATAYCHHIERLMVLGGFLFLCEVSPNHIYKWFMEMFIDSYDWVMVPNVYSMSQHADGGLITTKPYFCGSSYIRRMSNYSRGEWCDIYDGLYWRWIWQNRKRLSTNPRWAMMCKLADQMETKKMNQHLHRADNYLARIF